MLTVAAAMEALWKRWLVGETLAPPYRPAVALPVGIFSLAWLTWELRVVPRLSSNLRALTESRAHLLDVPTGRDQCRGVGVTQAMERRCRLDRAAVLFDGAEASALNSPTKHS